MAVGYGAITLQDVAEEIFGVAQAGDSLNDCFTASNDSGFDPSYKGSKDRLSNFQGYSHRAMIITPDATITWFDFWGDVCSPTPSYEIDGTEAWYVVIDNSEITSLGFDPLSDSDGYYNGAYFTNGGYNSNAYSLGGGVSIYWTSDDSWAANIGAAQTAEYEWCP